MKILVVTLPERGHYHPLLGPAAELVRRGHDVVWTAAADVRAELAAVGVERVVLPAGARRPSDEVRGAALAAVLRDPARLAAWIRELLVDAPRAEIDPLRAVIRDVRPDAIALDTMAYAAAIAADLERVPWVGWATSLNPVVDDRVVDSALVRTLRSLAGERRALWHERGLAPPRFRVSDALSPHGTACFATAALVGSTIADDSSVADDATADSTIADDPTDGTTAATDGSTVADDPTDGSTVADDPIVADDPADGNSIRAARTQVGTAIGAASLAAPTRRDVDAARDRDQRRQLARLPHDRGAGGLDDVGRAAPVVLVGPSCGGGPARGGALPDLAFAEDRPLVYASFGSQAWHQPARFARLAEACERLGFALVAATGDLAIGEAEHVRAAAYVDQRALLPRVSAFVTHGGANSIMEACAAGTPMLVAPLCNDQPHGAAIVARAGNGLALDLDTASALALDDALVRLVTDRSLRTRADAIRADYAAHDGAIGAADLVERAARLA